jgi:hypothetical protein
MSLPPLPNIARHVNALHRAIVEMVEAYGQQCRDAALEEAAKACDAANPHPDQWSDMSEFTERRVVLKLAAEIRSMK